MEPYQALEVEFARWNGLSPEGMVVVNSGTAALHLALESLRLPANSEAIVPDYTMVAVPRAVTLAGLKPVFADCFPEDLLLATTDGLRNRNTQAIIAVHTYGRRCDMDHLYYEAEPRGLFVIEDLAEAHGVPPGAGTDAACWSFYRNKIIAGEEGGAVWFRNPEDAALARQLRTLGFTAEHDYTHVPRGHNYRLANTLAELIRTSLRRADVNIPVRRIVESWYNQYCPEEWRQPARDAVWVYDFRIRGMEPIQQGALVRTLQAEGIAARFGFRPMTWQEEYLNRKWDYRREAAKACSEVVYLPVTPFVTREEDCERAFDIVKRVVTSWR